MPTFLLPSSFIPAQFYFENFHFRMALIKSLNAACNLNEYLFYKMPEGTLEVEIKVKTTWGKFTMIQNTHTRMERYHTWEKPQQCHVKSRKGKTPHKTASVHTEENTSETDMPTYQEFGYPTLIFNDPTHTAVMLHTDSEGEAIHDSQFQGRYCEYYNRSRETHCWCFSSNWEQELNVSNPNPSTEISSSSTGRKPPCRMVQKQMQSHQGNRHNEIPITKRRNQHK